MSDEIVWRDYTDVLPMDGEPNEITVRTISGEIPECDGWYGYCLTVRVEAIPEEIEIARKLITRMLEGRREDRARI